ncbi:hypothetical protein ABM108_003300 [Escherichia coli]|uniref:hypothetical protein n=1 Tax=Escherichia coli TaxID=562 RepID=UPI000DD5F518|nr:hypothetical protein [Escherichia coli]EFI6316369.1 hypothetical protein [Escherichia coli]EFN4181416.1 hypothetical protein [Escherichia coli]EGH1063667.1 hypothetical protein [Escherichia coli]EHI1047192.1 hypothetical protein [Escherichia coli]ELA5638755.1 hypothetical protein [Escherichia coli]
MKEEFQKLVCDIIDKSGVEIDTEERQKIIDEAIQTALEHIATSVSAAPLSEGSKYMQVWVRFGESPELPGVKQKRAALVAFSREMKDATVEVSTGAWYDGRIVYTNQTVCDEGERFEDIVDATLRTLKVRAGVADDPSIAAFLSIVEQSEVTERVTDLTTPLGLLELVVSGDIKKAVERIREVEYGIICDMCRSDLDLVRIIVDAGQACDGVLASFAGQVARLANELPMIKQEAKSYAVHHANDLLDPYRFEAAQDKMTGWATW